MATVKWIPTTVGGYRYSNHRFMRGDVDAMITPDDGSCIWYVALIVNSKSYHAEYRTANAAKRGAAGKIKRLGAL